MSKRIFIILVFLTITIVKGNCSVNVIVSGKVETNEHQPIADVLIWLNDSLVARTTENGLFVVKIPKNTISLLFTKDGFLSESVCVENPTTDIRTLMITLFQSKELAEVVVVTDSHLEVPTKTIYIPTNEEKKYSTNGYQLVDKMSIPDITSSNHNQSINILGGWSVQCLINGIEAQPNEIATLSAKDINRIEIQRTPGGKYVGKGGVINFITRQYEYGGNVYLSADEGFSYNYGNYLGFANYKNKALTLSATTSLKWDNKQDLSLSENLFHLNSGDMTQLSYPTYAMKSSRDLYFRLKMSHMKKNHSINVSMEFTKNSVPHDTCLSLTDYEGIVNKETLISMHNSANEISPKFKIDYTLYLKGNQYLNISGSISYGHNRFSGIYSETTYNDIEILAKENNQSYNGNIVYYYKLKNNSSLGVNISNSTQIYSDLYSGSIESTQRLRTSSTVALAQWQKTIMPLNMYYYISAGYSYTHPSINSTTYEYWNPVIYYGGNYAITQNQSISLNGNYLHTIFSPEYKNSVILPTSFFQANLGNPDLGVLNVFQNYVSYNGTFKNLKLSAIYDFMVYLNNISNKYFAKDDIVYKTLVNDGNFYSNRVILSATYGFLNNSLRLNVFSIAEFFHLRGNEYNSRNNGIRTSCSLAYYKNGWSFKGNYTAPYQTFSMQEPAYLKYKPQYGIIVAWNRRNLQIEAGAENFASKYRVKTKWFNYEAYDMFSADRLSSQGRNIYVSVTYNLPYGKKIDMPDKSYKTTINNAILKPF